LTDSLPAIIEAEFPINSWRNFRTLVAVSGGADSVAMLRAIVETSNRQNDDQATANLTAIHVNHNTRGEQSKEDAEFVRQLAADLKVSFQLVESGVDLPAPSDASEQSLRDFRYSGLIAAANKLGARYLMTGHQRNDQIETVLFRIFRGTGISGLSGIPPRRVVDTLTIVRPMLSISREAIEKYLSDAGQSYRSDISNSNCDYTRNFLRNEIIGQLKTKFPAVEDAVVRLSDQAAETSHFINALTPALDGGVIYQDAQKVEIDLSHWKGVKKLLIKNWLMQLWRTQHWPLQSMSAGWWQRLTDDAMDDTIDSLKLNLPGQIAFQIHNGRLLIQR